LQVRHSLSTYAYPPEDEGQSMRIRVVTDSSTSVPDAYLVALGIVEVSAVVTQGIITDLGPVLATLTAPGLIALAEHVLKGGSKR
jgi:hypothetical protein